MNTLFPIVPVYPDGFQYHKNFITQEEEKELSKVISGIQLHAFNFQGYEAKRKVASFGYDWSFDEQALKKGKEIPMDFQWLIDRVAAFTNLAQTDFAELLITEYSIGSVINWHRGAPPFALIAGISLGTDCIFKLRPFEKEKQGRKAVISLPVLKRSLYIMQGEARSNWQHSIAPVQRTRYSITLRTLNNQF